MMLFYVQFRNGREWDTVRRDDGLYWAGSRDSAIDLISEMRTNRLQKFRIWKVKVHRKYP